MVNYICDKRLFLEEESLRKAVWQWSPWCGRRALFFCYMIYCTVEHYFFNINICFFHNKIDLLLFDLIQYGFLFNKALLIY